MSRSSQPQQAGGRQRKDPGVLVAAYVIIYNVVMAARLASTSAPLGGWARLWCVEGGHALGCFFLLGLPCKEEGKRIAARLSGTMAGIPTKLAKDRQIAQGLGLGSNSKAVKYLYTSVWSAPKAFLKGKYKVHKQIKNSKNMEKSNRRDSDTK